MTTYYYCHTGHRIGLDRFRRAVTILGCMQEDITLLCSDFRIAQEAHNFGIEKAVGIDVVRNIANVAQRGDRLILDSAEVNPLMLEDMKQFFSKLYVIEEDTIVVAERYFEPKDKTVEVSFFFGDDDYEKDLQKHLGMLDGIDAHLGVGFYFFLDYEDELKKMFGNYFEFEEYDVMIQSSKILITASPQAAIESLASGGKPIYIQRADYTDVYVTKFEQLGIPIVYNFNKERLHEVFYHISEINYGKITPNCQKISAIIKQSLN